MKVLLDLDEAINTQKLCIFELLKILEETPLIIWFKPQSSLRTQRRLCLIECVSGEFQKC